MVLACLFWVVSMTRCIWNALRHWNQDLENKRYHDLTETSEPQAFFQRVACTNHTRFVFSILLFRGNSYTRSHSQDWMNEDNKTTSFLDHLITGSCPKFTARSISYNRILSQVK